MSLNARIKAAYKSGRKLSSILGFSDILGKRKGDKVTFYSLPKWDSSCFANNDAQDVQLLISEYLGEFPLEVNGTSEKDRVIAEEVYKELRYLEDNLNKTSGFMFLLGESTNNLFPEDYWEKNDSLVQLLTTAVGSAPDFTIGLRQRQYNLLGKVEVQISRLESRYNEWRYRSEVLKNIYQMVAEDESPEYVYATIQGITYTAECLNMLRKLFYWGRRYLMKLNKVEERYWNH